MHAFLSFLAVSAIAMVVPGPDTFVVLRTSLAATWGHWSQHVTRGPLHMTGRLQYGNDEVFARFHAAATGGPAVRDVSAQDAFDVLRMQHEILERRHVL